MLIIISVGGQMSRHESTTIYQTHSSQFSSNFKIAVEPFEFHFFEMNRFSLWVDSAICYSES